MADKSDTPTTPQTHEPNPILNKRLAGLVGSWDLEITMPLAAPNVIRGQATFDWLDEGPFLIERGSVEDPNFPTSTAIIGGDDVSEAYSMLYFDSRGVSRIYEMSLSSEGWELWRQAPGFSQRFIGKISGDGNTITGCWEKSSDGSNWELDFDLTYKRG